MEKYINYSKTCLTCEFNTRTSFVWATFMKQERGGKWQSLPRADGDMGVWCKGGNSRAVGWHQSLGEHGCWSSELRSTDRGRGRKKMDAELVRNVRRTAQSDLPQDCHGSRLRDGDQLWGSSESEAKIGKTQSSMHTQQHQCRWQRCETGVPCYNARPISAWLMLVERLKSLYFLPIW